MNFEAPNPSEDDKRGNKFLKDRFDLHKSDEVEKATSKTRRLSGEKIPQNPEYTIQSYINRLNGVLHPEDETQKERNLTLLKNTLHEKFILKEEDIPESYWELQRRIASERGEQYPEDLSDDIKSEAHEILAKDQAESLDQWIDYLSSDDAKVAYPDWAKIWAFKSVLKMADYDKESQTFGKRSKHTTGAFPDLNQEALATAIEYVNNIAEGEEIENPVQIPEDNPFADEEKPVSDEDFQKILSTQNFSKFYSFAIEHVVVDTSELWGNTDGEWVKFEQGSSAEELTKTLQGKGTGWCTAGTHTAEAQLSNGDFFVYYSQNELGENKIPRLAIRMQRNSIAEVRGVAHKQEIDPYISPILEEKMQEFGDEGVEYQNKAKDMQNLTEIHRKINFDEDLTKDELQFLYEFDHQIKGFGYEEDPRIEEIRNSRDVKKDLSIVLGVSKDKISLTQEEACAGDIEYHYGDLSLTGLTNATGLTLPQSIGGNLDLNYLFSADSLTLPQSIGGNLDLWSLTSAEGLILPESVGGVIKLGSLSEQDKQKLREQYPQHAEKI